MDFSRNWATSRKHSLGTVWHLVGLAGAAACSRNISLEEKTTSAPNADGPQDGCYVCARCRDIAHHWNAAKAERV